MNDYETKNLETSDYGRDYNRFPPGWWIAPAVVGGVIFWVVLFSLIF